MMTIRGHKKKGGQGHPPLGEDRATRRRLLCGRTPAADCLAATTTTTERGRWRGLLCQKDPAADEELPAPWREDSPASFIAWVGGFLTVAHVVPKRLLVVRELKSKVGVPSEPCTELIPSFFGLEMCAILVVWAICHPRSEGISW